MSTALTLSVLLVSVLLVAAKNDDSNSGRFSWQENSATTVSSSDTSSSSEKTTSDTLDSEDLRGERLARDQRRIELAVQAALLKDRVEPKFPAKPSYNTKSYQLVFTTLRKELIDTEFGVNVTNPTFGPVALLAFTSPADGLFGPERTRAQVTTLDNRTTFGTLFSEVRRAGFLGEFDLRTLVQSDSTFRIDSRALVTPCFPVTDEPGLTIEVVALFAGRNGQLRRKWLAIDRFFDNDKNFVEQFTEEIPLSRFDSRTARFNTTSVSAAVITATACAQFSYFA